MFGYPANGKVHFKKTSNFRPAGTFLAYENSENWTATTDIKKSSVENFIFTIYTPKFRCKSFGIGSQIRNTLGGKDCA